MPDEHLSTTKTK